MSQQKAIEQLISQLNPAVYRNIVTNPDGPDSVEYDLRMDDPDADPPRPVRKQMSHIENFGNKVLHLNLAEAQLKRVELYQDALKLELPLSPDEQRILNDFNKILHSLFISPANQKLLDRLDFRDTQGFIQWFMDKHLEPEIASLMARIESLQVEWEAV